MSHHEQRRIDEFQGQPRATRRSPSVGEILVSHGAVEASQVEAAVDEARIMGGRVGETLVRRARVSRADVAKALALQTGLPYAPPELIVRDDELLAQFPLSLLQRLGALPVRGAHPCTVAVADPTDAQALSAIADLFTRPLQVVVSDADVIAAALAGRQWRDAPSAAAPDQPHEDRRSTRRVPCHGDLRCAASFEDERELQARAFAGNVLDLSLVGAAISAVLPADVEFADLAEGTEIQLLVEDGGDPKLLRLDCRISWCTRLSDRDCHLGVTWRSPSPESDGRLTTLVARAHAADAKDERRRELLAFTQD